MPRTLNPISQTMLAQDLPRVEDLLKRQDLVKAMGLDAETLSLLWDLRRHTPRALENALFMLEHPDFHRWKSDWAAGEEPDLWQSLGGPASEERLEILREQEDQEEAARRGIPVEEFVATRKKTMNDLCQKMLADPELLPKLMDEGRKKRARAKPVV